MSAEITRVPFMNGFIDTVLIETEPHVVIRSTLAAMGVDADSQMKKLKRKSWGSTVVTTVQIPGDDQTRDVAVVDLDTWSMLLANIDENRVSEAARPLVVEYQKKSARALREYWTQGGAINPAATRDQVTGLRARLDGVERARLAQERLSAMGVAKQFGLVNSSYVEAMARTELARMNGEEPDIDPTDVTITCDEYLTEQGVAGTDLASARVKLGKGVAALYRMRYGQPPQKVKRPINGVHRDIDLFDTAWAELARHYNVQTAIGGAA